MLQEGTGSRPRGIRYRIPKKGVAELITHHKVAAGPSQPWRGRRIEAANGPGLHLRDMELAAALC